MWFKPEPPISPMSLPMPDAYQNFAALRRHEFEWIDFRVVVEDRHSPVAIVAPHGGKIEPGTSQIATAIAGLDYSLYCFEGIKRTGNARLHVTSSNFDEHRCLALIATCPSSSPSTAARAPTPPRSSAASTTPSPRQSPTPSPKRASPPAQPQPTSRARAPTTSATVAQNTAVSNSSSPAPSATH